jgi:hypothetical protein
MARPFSKMSAPEKNMVAPEFFLMPPYFFLVPPYWPVQAIYKSKILIHPDPPAEVVHQHSGLRIVLLEMPWLGCAAI